MKLFQLLPEKIVHLTCNWPLYPYRVLNPFTLRLKWHAAFSALSRAV